MIVFKECHQDDGSGQRKPSKAASFVTVKPDPFRLNAAPRPSLRRLAWAAILHTGPEVSDEPSKIKPPSADPQAAFFSSLLMNELSV